MSTNVKTALSQPTSAVRNTLGKEQVPQDLGGPAFDAALREYCNRNYYQLLPKIAEKVHQEKVQQEKLKAVKARLNFEEASQHSELGTPSSKKDLKKRLGYRHVRSMSESPEPRRGHYEDVKGAPECMKISEFMHGITNPELIKRLHDKIPKSIDEMMRVTMTFLRGEVAASSRERKKSFSSWKQQEVVQKQNFKKGGFLKDM
nr:reverse transcriptase domain-containing protein [Tanacetum cinerariifolium]